MAMVVREVHDPEYVPNGNEIAVIKTARGTVRVKLYGLECPLTVGQFVQLAQDGFYDNLAFHARKEDSVVLGGCPITRNMPPPIRCTRPCMAYCTACILARARPNTASGTSGLPIPETITRTGPS